jgi:hypothetical protein
MSKYQPILDICARYSRDDANEYDKSFRVGRVYKGEYEGKPSYFIQWAKGVTGPNGLDPHSYRFNCYEHDAEREAAMRSKYGKKDDKDDLPF